MGILQKFALVLCLFFSCANAGAVILFGGDNAYNTSAPSGSEKLDSFPFNSVVKVYLSSYPIGSAVYLGNGFFITAAHVKPTVGKTRITLDGAKYYDIAPYYEPVTVAEGLDAKIFYVDANAEILSTLASVNLYGGSIATGSSFYFSGYGRGRVPESEAGAYSVNWGDFATRAHRWGTNVIIARQTYADSTQGLSYSAYVARLDSDAGADEAALTEGDSGGGMFYYSQFVKKWYLVGIAVGTTVSDKSTFQSSDASGDYNIFLNVGAYYSNIQKIISNVPSGYAVYAYQNMPASASEERAPDAIPHADGISNLEKYTFGLDMSKPASYVESGNFLLSVADGKASFSFSVRSSASDVTATVYTSSNLADWTEITARKTSVSGDFDIRSVTVDCPDSAGVFFKVELRQ